MNYDRIHIETHVTDTHDAETHTYRPESQRSDWTRQAYWSSYPGGLETLLPQTAVAWRQNKTIACENKMTEGESMQDTRSHTYSMPPETTGNTHKWVEETSFDTFT